MKAYTVTAKRWARGWELHIDGVGVTQSHGLTDAAGMARDYIATILDVPASEIAVEVTPEVGGGLDQEAAAARDALREAEQAQRAAAAQSREVVQRLKAVGLTGKDVAAVLHVSPQRVSQLSARPGARERTGRRRKTAAGRA